MRWPLKYISGEFFVIVLAIVMVFHSKRKRISQKTVKRAYNPLRGKNDLGIVGRKWMVAMKTDRKRERELLH